MQTGEGALLEPHRCPDPRRLDFKPGFLEAFSAEGPNARVVEEQT